MGEFPRGNEQSERERASNTHEAPLEGAKNHVSDKDNYWHTFDLDPDFETIDYFVAAERGLANDTPPFTPEPQDPPEQSARADTPSSDL